MAELVKRADPTWGMSQCLPWGIGALRAREPMYTGRVAEGREAVAVGLANRCVPDDELDAATLELARAVVAKR